MCNVCAVIKRPLPLVHPNPHLAKRDFGAISQPEGSRTGKFTMPRFTIILCLVGLIVACTPNDPTPATVVTTIPTDAPLQGQVLIDAPTSGSILYSEVLYLEGTAQGLVDDTFMLRVVGVEGDTIAEATIRPEDGAWSTEIVHDYSGDPTEVTISARSAEATVRGDYDIVSVILSSLENRPEGTFGRITSPQAGGVIGGDSALVFGTASGIPDNTLTLTLQSSDGTPISERVLRLPSPYSVDDVAWTAELDTGDFTGAAVLTVSYLNADGEREILASTNVNISSVAG